MKKIIILFLSMSILLLPSFVHAQERDHNSGLLLRFLLGGGQGSFIGENSSDKIEHEGTARLFNFQLGWFVAPNWALYGGLSTIGAGDTDVKTNSVEVSDGVYQVSNLVFGISYYIMPINISISPEWHFRGKATTQFKNDENGLKREHTYKNGSGFGFTVGKEWFVSSSWGLGVALSYYQDTFSGDKNRVPGTIIETDLDLDGYHSYFGIAFSATYN